MTPEQMKELKKKIFGKDHTYEMRMKLQNRIKNGEMWLSANGDHLDFEKNLELYESLCNQLKNLEIVRDSRQLTVSI